MTVYDLIRKKRDGQRLSSEEIRTFIQGYANETIPDYQASAMAMAIFFRGLSDHELMAWTRAMLESGDVFDLSHVQGYKVDKHSTGGVGDKTSLILAPIVAAAGYYVPMISGRGLGHTGGTLDKLEAIPGFSTNLPTERFQEILQTCGFVMAGQTRNLVPADRKLYALRDVTATVDSIPLIASSIMSKKLAEDINGLVLDVKFGDGAFMKDIDKARELAQKLVSIGLYMNKEVIALLTDMSQPLGTHIGNSLEVVESCEVLRGRVRNDLSELSFHLAAEMIAMARGDKDIDEAHKRVHELIASGAAFRKFQEIVAAQGGDPRSIEDYSRLPQARGVTVLTSPSDGYICSISCEKVGRLAVQLGAGRERVEDSIDPAVGFILHNKVGAKIQRGDHLVTVYYNDESKMETIREALIGSFVFQETPVETSDLIRERVIGEPSST